MGQPERSPAPGAPVAGTSGAGEGGLSRRLFVGAGATTLGLAAAACSAMPAARKSRARLQLTLFPATGPHPVGTVPLHLVDRSRRDPWVPARRRELMVSVWYPALDAGRYPRAPWIPDAAGALFLRQLIPSLVDTSKKISRRNTPPPLPVSLHGVRLPLTRARQGAPAGRPAQRYPVVLYQPGFGDVRELGTGLVSDLASRGYVVVTMDDTYEAAEVEFPGRRVAVPRGPSGYADATRIADTRFVLDELAALEPGVNPTPDNARCLPGSRGRST